MIELCCEYLSVQCIWLYVMIMLHTSSKVNLNAIVCLNVKELLAWSRCHIWGLNDSNRIPPHNHLVCKQTLNHLPKLVKWLSCYLNVGCIWLYVCVHADMLQSNQYWTRWGKRNFYEFVRGHPLMWSWINCLFSRYYSRSTLRRPDTSKTFANLIKINPGYLECIIYLWNWNWNNWFFSPWITHFSQLNKNHPGQF